MTPDLRQKLEAVVDGLIDLLDTVDGDVDREPEEDAEHDGREPADATLLGSFST